MKGNGQSFKYLKNELFEIPFFQRLYVWKEENWVRLLESIDEEKGNCFPYLGSIILKRNNDSEPWLVIDGQQRLTTLSILIKAFLDVYSNNILQRIINEYEDIIYKVTQIGMDLKYQLRIKPSSVDKNDYENVMNHDRVVVTSRPGLIAEAYNFFKANFESRTPEQLQLLATKISETSEFIIVIELDKEDDEQKIFNSVNDYGQRLTSADIIKNDIFQVLKQKSFDMGDVLDTYKRYWDEPFYQNERKEFWYEVRTYGRITQLNLEEFLKDYALIKGFYRASTKTSLSEAYRIEIQNSCQSYNDIKNFIKDLAHYANKFYEMISEYEQENDYKISEYTNSTLRLLNEIECTTFIPLVLKIYCDDTIAEKDEYLFEIQRFLLERMLYNGSNKNYNKNVEILLGKKTVTDAIDYLYKVNKDDDFNLDSFPIGLVGITNQRAAIILFFIEMIRRKGREDMYSDTLIYNKTLEHIMPRKWEKNWSDVPCYDYDADGDYIEITNNEDVKTIRKKSVYSIGNMTLLSSSLNSSISNSDFTAKIEGKIVRGKLREGIQKYVGSLSIASEIVDLFNEQTTTNKIHIWTEIEINKRAEKLFKELDNYFHFSNNYIEKHEPLLKRNNDKVILDMRYVLDEITDEFLNEKRIAIVVTECIKYLFKNNILNEEEIINLQSKEYCSSTFSCWKPLLSVEPDDPIRYYKETLNYNGVDYYITKEWTDRNREKFIKWFNNMK